MNCLYLVFSLLINLNCNAQEASKEDALSIRSILKPPSTQLHEYDNPNLGSRLIETINTEGNPEKTITFIQAIETHKNYESFIDKSKRLPGITAVLSDEARYFILINWARSNNQETWDQNGYFPVVSTAAIKFVYLPLGYLLLQRFRENDPTQDTLLNLCQDQIETYIEMMLEEYNPYTPKEHRHDINKLRLPYVVKLIEQVFIIDEGLPSHLSPRHIPRISFSDETKDYEGCLTKPKRVSVNHELKSILTTSNIIKKFCVYRLSANSDTSPAFTQKDLILLHPKYSILYDFVLYALVEHKIEYLTHFNDILSMMICLSPSFDSAWMEIEDPDTLTQAEIIANFYPKILKSYYRLNPNNGISELEFNDDSMKQSPIDFDLSPFEFIDLMPSASSSNQPIPEA